MDDAQGSDIHGDEIKGLNIDLRSAKTNSNGNRSRVNSIELVETMKGLKKEVHRYREDNGRLIRAQEDHNQINT